MASWSAYQTESEEEALAKAMQLSLMEDKKSSRKAEFPIHIGEEKPDGRLSSREAPSSSSSSHQRQPQREEARLLKSAHGGHSAGALPLCLPNNYQWNSKTRQCVKTEEKRSSLYFVEDSLLELRKIKSTGLFSISDKKYLKCKKF
ncbi:hypothetical protein pdam_00010459 [Pocillopora damicornis]|uniref:Uncharacterized protein n=1 Tax=Pocillopora damicornis TaxID=46731 RepID=A0A3M6U9N8_POCDA|nr:hypothetical protein pdam_00010459 [Pocillopora damicornis]